MRGGSTRRRIVALVALVVVAGACGNASTSTSSSSPTSGSKSTTTVNQPGVTKDEIRVGGVASITNALNAPYGDIFKGVKAYFAMVNSQGGIDGRKLVVVSQRDDQMTNNLQETQALINEDNVFAAVGMATIFSFSGADTLAGNGMPVFGWNINADWNHPNFFGNSGALCFGCEGVLVPWVAKQLGRKTVGILSYNVENSQQCAEGVKKSFEKYPTAKVGYYSDSLNFGVSDFSVEVGKMKDAGVDFIVTCLDTNAVLALAKEVKQQNLDAVQYLPNGYDQDFMKANGQFFDGSIVRVPFVPYEVTPKPQGLADYLAWMKKQGDTPNEYTTYGWINAAMLVEGLRGAGANFTQQKVVDALNKLKNDTAGGMLSGIDWTTQHTDSRPPVGCDALVKVQNKQFVPVYVPKGKAFICFKEGDTPDSKPTFR